MIMTSEFLQKGWHYLPNIITKTVIGRSYPRTKFVPGIKSFACSNCSSHFFLKGIGNSSGGAER